MNFPKTANDLYGIIVTLSESTYANLGNREVSFVDILVDTSTNERDFSRITIIQRWLRELESNGYITSKQAYYYKPMTDPVDITRMKRINSVLAEDKVRNKKLRKLNF